MNSYRVADDPEVIALWFEPERRAVRRSPTSETIMNA